MGQPVDAPDRVLVTEQACEATSLWLLHQYEAALQTLQKLEGSLPSQDPKVRASCATQHARHAAAGAVPRYAACCCHSSCWCGLPHLPSACSRAAHAPNLVGFHQSLRAAVNKAASSMTASS